MKIQCTKTFRTPQGIQSLNYWIDINAEDMPTFLEQRKQDYIYLCQIKGTHPIIEQEGDRLYLLHIPVSPTPTRASLSVTLCQESYKHIKRTTN